MPPTGVGPPDVIAYVLADLAVILVAARIVGAIFVRLRQPRIVGEIIAGILIGPTVLGGHVATPKVDGSGLVNRLYPLQAFSFLNLIGQVGLVFFMFLVGLELHERLLKGKEAQILAMALAVVAVPVGFGFLAATVLDSSTWRPAGVSTVTFGLFLGAAISVTAFPVMARILQEKGLLLTEMGAVGIGAAAVVTVLMFLVIAAATASAKGAAGIPKDVGVKFGWTVGLLAVLLVARLLVGPLLARVDQPRYHDTILAAMLALALMTGLAADRIGIHALVGGFLFGVAVPASEGLAEKSIQRMQPAVVLFFLPVFLAVSGLRTDFRLLDWDLLPGIAFFLALMIIGKWVVGYGVGRALGLRSDEAHTIGVLLNCRGLLILVVALIGITLATPTITPQMQLAFVIGAIVTTLMTGPLVDKFAAKPEAPQEGEESRPVAIAALPS